MGWRERRLSWPLAECISEAEEEFVRAESPTEPPNAEAPIPAAGRMPVDGWGCRDAPWKSDEGWEEREPVGGEEDAGGETPVL